MRILLRRSAEGLSKHQRIEADLSKLISRSGVYVFIHLDGERLQVVPDHCATSAVTVSS